MPVTNLAGLRRMAALSGVSVPDWLGHMFDGLDDDLETRRMVAAVVAAEQVRLLQANGVDEFHFYTLNRADLAYCDRPYPRRAPDAARTGAARTDSAGQLIAPWGSTSPG